MNGSKMHKERQKKSLHMDGQCSVGLWVLQMFLFSHSDPSTLTALILSQHSPRLKRWPPNESQHLRGRCAGRERRLGTGPAGRFNDNCLHPLTAATVASRLCYHRRRGSWLWAQPPSARRSSSQAKQLFGFGCCLSLIWYCVFAFSLN